MKAYGCAEAPLIETINQALPIANGCEAPYGARVLCV